MRRSVFSRLAAASALLQLPSIVRADFLSTTLDAGSFSTTRITDPAGPNTFVSDRLAGQALGNNLPVPIGQSVTVGVDLPPNTAIRVAPGIAYDVELILGAQNLTGAGMAIISSFSGSMKLDVNGRQTTGNVPFFNEAILSGHTIAFRMSSASIPATGINGAPSMIDGFHFTFNIGSVGLLNNAPLLADELRLTVRGSTGVPNAQVATLPPLVAVAPAPIAGDANFDGTVNSLDFNILSMHFNASGTVWETGNFNGDSVTNALDFNALATHYGQGPAAAVPSAATLVPEPVTACAISLLAAFGSRRWRRSNAK